jgi:SAM-dependent methyltransferase
VSDAVKRDVRRYYRRVSRFIDRERRTSPDAPLWQAIAREHRGGRGLDMGCGTGRVGLILAGELRAVVGVDLSPEMLAKAAGARRAAGETGRRFHPLAADLRGLALRRRFDLVVAANDPLAHLGDGEGRDRVLTAVAAHLEPGEGSGPGGRFVLDCHWFPPDRLRRALTGAGLVEEHAGEGLDVRETWHCRPDGSCRARYEYLRDGERVEEAGFESRYWSPEELRERFDRAGLRVTALWGDYDRSPWSLDSARHLIVEARRV